MIQVTLSWSLAQTSCGVSGEPIAKPALVVGVFTRRHSVYVKKNMCAKTFIRL